MLYRFAAELESRGTPFVAVTLVATVGSAPQDPGAKMLVTSGGPPMGTVGGGKLEAKAIDCALALLASEAAGPRLVEWNLQTDVGMTCGGKATLLFEPHIPWRVIIFGAGHVSQKLVRVLLLNPRCLVQCIDPRREWLDRLPDSFQLEKVAAASWEALPEHTGQLRDTDFVLLMTRGHATDRPVLDAIFRSGRTFRYLGVIGSDAKRKIIVRELRAAGIPDHQAEGFRCPIGLRGPEERPLGGNDPSEIAVSIMAELLVLRDSLKRG